MYSCATCNVTVYSKEYLDRHLNSVRHAREMASAEGKQPMNYCLVCDVVCSSPEWLVKHLDGARHAKNVAALPLPPPPPSSPAAPPPAPPALQPIQHCALCNVTCSNAEWMEKHLNGVRHQALMHAPQAPPPTCDGPPQLDAEILRELEEMFDEVNEDTPPPPPPKNKRQAKRSAEEQTKKRK